MGRYATHLKKAGLNALYFSGAYRLMAPYTRGVGAVLMFHHVRPRRPGDFAPHDHLEVTPEFLEAVVKRVRASGVEIVSMDEAKARIGRPNGRRFCAITFDDGYRDNLEVAYPVLKALGCPFTVYVATGLIDRTADLWWNVVERVVERQDVVALSIDGPIGYFPSRTLSQKLDACDRICRLLFEAGEDVQRAVVRELAWKYGVDTKALLDEEMMTWEEVRQLASDPLVTIGAHTVGHYALGKLPPARARAEMRDGARVLEAALGKAPRHFAYPYGSPQAADDREFQLAEELGFATAVTTRPGVLGSGHASTPTAWPRVSINGRFQSLHYVDVFLTGAAYALYNAFDRPQAARAGGVVKAAASSG